MHTIEWLAALFATLVLLINSALYVQRALILRRVAACEQDDTLGVLDAAGAFLRDCVALAAAMLLTPAGWCLAPCVTGLGRRGPLVLLHDRGLNRGALWWLRHRLVRDGWSPVFCLDCRSSPANVERAAMRLRTAVDIIAGDRPVTVIAHGFGGLVARYYVRHHPAPNVHRIVTLGTPHLGTLARLPGSRHGALAPTSPLLQALQAADRVPRQFDVIAIQSSFDQVVVPPRNAEYPGAFNIRVTAVGHYALLFSRRVYELLVENLAAPIATASARVQAPTSTPVLGAVPTNPTASGRG